MGSHEGARGEFEPIRDTPRAHFVTLGRPMLASRPRIAPQCTTMRIPNLRHYPRLGTGDRYDGNDGKAPGSAFAGCTIVRACELGYGLPSRPCALCNLAQLKPSRELCYSCARQQHQLTTVARARVGTSCSRDSAVCILGRPLIHCDGARYVCPGGLKAMLKVHCTSHTRDSR
jgi:hypothetical protein